MPLRGYLVNGHFTRLRKGSITLHANGTDCRSPVF
jgi:hypothetical protein